MPLPERVIQPVNVSRGTLQYQVPDELEGVTNGSLSNIIRQLSSLSRHAEEIFGNLFKDAEAVAIKSSNLQAKVDRLAIRVTQLDSTVEEVSLHDIHLRKPFRSSQAFDQQVVARETMPKAMLEVYLACDKPPPLDKLNPYRDDGKDGLKFYTDANYFFELWKQGMLKDTERMIHDRVKKNPAKTNGSANSKDPANRSKKRLRQPHNTAEKHRQKALGRGEYIMQSENNDASYQEHQLNEMYHNQMYMGEHPHNGQLNRPNTIDVTRSYGEQEQQQQQFRQQVQQNNMHQMNQYGNGHVTNGQHYQHSNEPIYMPRVLLSNSHHDQPPSQRHFANSNNNGQAYQPPTNLEQFGNGRPPFDFSSAVEQLDISGFQRDDSPMGSGSGTPSRGGQRRPSQPPPAPPPISSNAGTPTRSLSVQRDNLPPPPPPPPSSETPNGYHPSQQGTFPLQQQQHIFDPPNSHFYSPGEDPDLPPPPPVPEISSEPLPPPPVDQIPVNGPPAPPPPPPPPPMNGFMTNGSNMMNGNHDKMIKSGSPLKTDSSSPPKHIMSPLALKKPAAPAYLMKQDNVRSDLLKAIRDGIELKKVEESKKAAIEKETSGNGQSDVASILARRVAVEMSDSDDHNGGNSDSEYDSDDWDESTA